MNGNTSFGSNCSFTDGYVYHPTGTSLSGGGTWTDGGSQNPAPSFPPFDTTYYDNLITAAYSVPAGNQTYSNTTLNLAGSTIYVNGNVTISGNTTINGPGTIVATGTINQSGNTYSSSAPKFISQGNLYVAGNAYTSGSTYYSATHITAEGNTRVDVGGMLSKGGVALAGNLNLSGIVFSNSGTSFVSGNPVIRGALVANSFSTFSGNANVVFDESKFPSNMPTGFTASSLTVKKGSWRGN
jgi:formylmethanofuran dehydrogenase subunit C